MPLILSILFVLFVDNRFLQDYDAGLHETTEGHVVRCTQKTGMVA